jgi:hypothetical protein
VAPGTSSPQRQASQIASRTSSCQQTEATRITETGSPAYASRQVSDALPAPSPLGADTRRRDRQGLPQKPCLAILVWLWCEAASASAIEPSEHCPDGEPQFFVG